LILVALLAAVPVMAQRPAPANPEESFYRLDFVLRELEDSKVMNTRSYSMWLATGEGRGGGASIRAGNDIPMMRSLQTDKPADITYRNAGVNIDCRLVESPSGPVLNMSGSVTNVVAPEQGMDNKLLPVFRNINFNAYALLTPGKPTFISSADDPGSKRRFTLEVTATKLK